MKRPTCIATVAIALVVTGCGGGSDKPAQPTAPQDVVKQFLREVAAENPDSACALLSPAGRDEAAKKAQESDFSDALNGKDTPEPTCKRWLGLINAENVAQETLNDFGYTHTDYEQNHAVVRAKNGDWALEKVVGKWRIQTVETLAQAG